FHIAIGFWSAHERPTLGLPDRRERSLGNALTSRSVNGARRKWSTRQDSNLHPPDPFQLSYVCDTGAATETRTPVCRVRAGASLPLDDRGGLAPRAGLEPGLTG